MKKIARLFLFATVLLQVHLYSQTPTITGIQVVNILDDAVVLEWLSDYAEGVQEDFVLYYNPSNAISSSIKQKDSRVVRARNFQGPIPNQNGLYLYSAELPIRISGEFYFAVAPAQGLGVDAAIQEGAGFTSAYNLKPEQGYTVQSIAFRLQSSARKTAVLPQNTALVPILIRSLNLSSEEDIFRLTWQVSPHGLNSYTFKIYRSKYPLTGLFPNGEITEKTLSDLPTYAVVKDRFYFEDRSISFETPYYYAVVAEGSSQWQPGLNVFHNPAVLVRTSPPFTITPQQETVKTVRPFRVDQSEPIEEKDIEKAVQQTLNNLIYAPSGQKRTEDPTYMPNVEPMSPNEFRNDPNKTLPYPSSPEQETSYRGALPQQSDQAPYAEAFYRKMASNYRVLARKEMLIVKDLEDANRKETAKYIGAIQNLKKDIHAYFQKKEKLATVSQQGDRRFHSYVHALLQDRERILLKEFSLKNSKYTLQRASVKRKSLAQQQLTSAQKEFKKNQDILVMVKKIENKVRIAGIKDEKYLGFINPVETKQTIPNIEDLNTSIYRMPVLIEPQVRLQSIADIEISAMEKIPSLIELEQASQRKENWISKKVSWRTNNSQLWEGNIFQWQSSVPKLFDIPKNYEILNDRWNSEDLPIPRRIALDKGKVAFDKEAYDEAAFFLVKAPDHDGALMMLGKSFYAKEFYKEAVSVFSVARNMGVPDASDWLLKASEAYVKPKIEEKSTYEGISQEDLFLDYTEYEDEDALDEEQEYEVKEQEMVDNIKQEYEAKEQEMVDNIKQELLSEEAEYTQEIPEFNMQNIPEDSELTPKNK